MYGMLPSFTIKINHSCIGKYASPMDGMGRILWFQNIKNASNNKSSWSHLSSNHDYCKSWFTCDKPWCHGSCMPWKSWNFPKDVSGSQLAFDTLVTLNFRGTNSVKRRRGRVINVRKKHNKCVWHFVICVTLKHWLSHRFSSRLLQDTWVFRYFFHGNWSSNATAWVKVLIPREALR